MYEKVHYREQIKRHCVKNGTGKFGKGVDTFHILGIFRKQIKCRWQIRADYVSDIREHDASRYLIESFTSVLISKELIGFVY